MNTVVEHTTFLVRDREGKLVPKMPEILNYLRQKVERAKEKYGADELEIAWCLNTLAGEENMRAKLKQVRNDGLPTH